ncbi:hypothetical protein CROQUDRAFT_657194 [Cronartium quercuum f. sp. fusiforme G11]|uniref:Uncharacterized protein n=1 Tax=Cronartium quercuum f. sp. fusiforme G11 TaxID=708437 RepID=A0A9P6NN54_9BASI|nr:hypothetical protein CROQUDRAFT_657194 [Cronartium quercuum f. sp. fusiforme G11]
MLFNKIFLIIFTFLLAQHDGIVNGNSLTPRSPLPNAVIESEGTPGGMPPCPQLGPYIDYPLHLDPWPILNRDIRSYRNRGPDWHPKCCDYFRFLCVYVERGVTISPWKTGAGSVLYAFDLGRGTHVDIIWYWQGTIQYTAPGGTVSFYAAHGNNYVCVKGGMQVRTLRNGKTMRNFRGFPGRDDIFNCECNWIPKYRDYYLPDDDLIIFSHRVSP